jgi:hypothetical protein
VPSLLEAGAVYVTAIVLAELAGEVGETLPDVALTVAVAPEMAVPPVVYRNVSVKATVLWPSASTVALGGLSVNVIPRSVIVEVAVNPRYVAVTVALLSLLEAGVVYVTAIVLAELAGDVGVTLPEVALTVAVAPEMAVPPVVYRNVSVNATVLWPSASTVALAGVKVKVIPRKFTVPEVEADERNDALTVAVTSVELTDDRRST